MPTIGDGIMLMPASSAAGASGAALAAGAATGTAAAGAA